MTTDDYVTQRQLNARSSQISKKVSVENIKNTADEFMYLEIDLKNKRVTNHEGRHRLNALLNAGNAFADIFVIPVNDTGVESYGNIEVQGQFNTDKHRLGLVRAKSAKFANAINEVFRKDDGNIRYALPETDSEGNTLTDKQREYFAGSKIVDENGKLLVNYHGTDAEFTVFDNSKSLKSIIEGGLYFTTDKNNAEAYASRQGNKGRIIEAYLNITGFLDLTDMSIDYVNDVIEHIPPDQLELAKKINRDLYGGFSFVDLANNVYKNNGSYKNACEVIEGWGYDGAKQDNDTYVAFHSNQIKTINNINPTINDDIRYALENDAEIKDLVAVHNLSQEKLKQAIKLGGFAVPSIAITKTEYGHENFGEISLIFGKQTISPTDRRNKVFDSDVYSRRFPSVVNKISEKNLNELLKTFWNAAKVFNSSPTMLESDLEYSTKENAAYMLSREDFVKYQYLTEQGITIEKKQKQKQGRAGLPLKYIQEFAQKHKEITDRYNDTEVIEQLTPEITEVYNQMYADYNLEKEKTVSYKDADRFLYDVAEYNVRGEKAFITDDIYALKDDIDAALKGKEKEFEQYIQNLVDKYYEDTRYFRNNVDLFTSSGNRRSFNSLYTEATLENIVSYMTGKVQNEEGYNYGTGNIRSVMSKQFKSVEEIKQSSDRIVSHEKMEALKAATDSKTFDIAAKMAKLSSESNSFIATDTALDILVEIAKSSQTNARIISIFNDYYGKAPSQSLISEIQDYLKELKEYQTEYFEAKPQRAVYFSEVLEVIAPENVDSEIVEFFNKQGIRVELYNENTNSRSSIIKNLPDDVKFALPMDDNEDMIVGGLTKGQRAKFVANNTKLKVYSKSDAVDVINSIIEERLVLGDKYGTLAGKNKAEVIDMLFRQLNATTEGFRGTAALHIADYLIENTVLNDMYIDDSEDVMWQLKILQGYMHKVDLKSIQGEINYKYDKKNSINLVWGAKQGGMAPDVIAQELNSLGIRIDAVNEADCFFEMIDTYNALKSKVNKTADKQKLSTFGSQSQLENLRQEIARDILLAYDEKGTQSKYGKLVEKYTAKIQSLKQQVKESERRNNAINAALEKAQNMKDLKLGTFLNATDFKSDIFKSSIESLAKIKWRGNLNSTGTHKIMADLKQWYVEENPILEGCYEQGIADMLDILASGNKKYTTDELVMLNNVLSYFTNFVKNYNRVYKQGKWIEALPEAERYINVLHNNEQVKVGLFRKIAGSMYSQTFSDPMTVARRMDLYESGFYTEMMTDLREAAVDAQVAEMEVKSDYDSFLKKHKKYLTEISKEKVKYKNIEIPKAHLISLAMTLKREHAQAGLALNGFTFVDTDKKKIRVKGFAPSIMLDADLITAVVEEQMYIDSLLSDTDREYITILEKAYNQDAKKLKADRDMQRLGFTNAKEDYYYPIKRGNIAKNIDTSDIAAELDRVSNSSFNKDTVKGAKQELFIESADVVFNRHIHAVCQYSYLSPAIETFNRLFNLDISGNKNKPISIATESANTWAKGNNYFKKLISDIQGIPTSSGEGMKALGFIRGNYAKFQLGANPKVWFTQLSSIFASSSILDSDSIIKGMAVSTKDVDTYCSLAKLRNADNTAAMAQGVLDRSVGKVSNALMAPIGKMDRFVVRKLFGACQVQVAKNGGAKVGTHENKVAAGQLLKRVILETQQNSIATERSAAMRSGNEVLRTLTMFTADSMKVIGRVIDSIGEYSTLRAKYKAATNSEVKAQLKIKLKAAQRKVRKSVLALLLSAAFMASVAKLFRWLYNKEDENEIETTMVDFVGNLFGGLPLIKDVYARLAEGYELDNYAYSAINDLLDSASSLINTTKNIVTDTASEKDIAKNIKNLTYSVGQLLGIPTRNLYNVVYGLTKRISPSSAYKIDNAFYNKNYVADLKEAIKNDDEQMIATIMSLLLNERVGEELNDKSIQKLKELYAAGYSVLPKSVGDSITYNDETIELTNHKQESIKNVYSQANKLIDKMIVSTSFNGLSAEAQAKAIKQIYDAYYDKALIEVLGIEKTNTLLQQSKYFDIVKLAVINAGLAEISSEKDNDGKTISGSKKSKVIKFLNNQPITVEQKLLLLVLKGYSIQDGDIFGLSEKQIKTKLLKYIITLKGVSKAERAELAKKCGFEVKNGKIVNQFAMFH